MRKYAPFFGAVVCSLPVALLVLAFMPSPNDTGTWSAIVVEIQSVQRSLHRELAATLQTVQQQGATAAVWLITLSFLYGVLHAVGPGHGKVVITTYLMTQRSRLSRGIALSVLTSLFQGFTAIVTVGVGVVIVGQSLRQAQSTADDLELLSYALVAIAGLVVVVSRARRLFAWWLPGHEHAARADVAPPSEHVSPHTGDCCGHSHGPTAAELERPLSWRAVAGMATAVGIRPCSGAIVVLLVAHSLKLHWAGAAAVLAMSLGTAIAVSVLAAMAVYARTLAESLSARLPGRAGYARVAAEIVALLGGLTILLIGLLLFQAAWTTPVHPLR